MNVNGHIADFRRFIDDMCGKGVFSDAQLTEALRMSRKTDPWPEVGQGMETDQLTTPPCPHCGGNRTFHAKAEGMRDGKLVRFNSWCEDCRKGFDDQYFHSPEVKVEPVRAPLYATGMSRSPDGYLSSPAKEICRTERTLSSSDGYELDPADEIAEVICPHCGSAKTRQGKEERHRECLECKLVWVHPWESVEVERLSRGKLDAEGGEFPVVSREALKQADFITLPQEDDGVNCGNCQFSKKSGDGLACSHPKLRGQPVTDRQCCSYWNAPGALRTWMSGPAIDSRLSRIPEQAMSLRQALALAHFQALIAQQQQAVQMSRVAAPVEKPVQQPPIIVSPPNVTVNIPPSQVHVDAPVNVQPAVPATVNVSVPTARASKKIVERDKDGLITSVREEID